MITLNPTQAEELKGRLTLISTLLNEVVLQNEISITTLEAEQTAEDHRVIDKVDKVFNNFEHNLTADQRLALVTKNHTPFSGMWFWKKKLTTVEDVKGILVELLLEEQGINQMPLHVNRTEDTIKIGRIIHGIQLNFILFREGNLKQREVIIERNAVLERIIKLTVCVIDKLSSFLNNEIPGTISVSYEDIDEVHREASKASMRREFDFNAGSYALNEDDKPNSGTVDSFMRILDSKK